MIILEVNLRKKVSSVFKSFLGTGHTVQGGGGGVGRQKWDWVINFQADEKGWVT